MKQTEPRSFSSSFFSFLFFYFLSFCSSEPLATQCTYSTSPPCLNVCLSSSNEVMITWWSECTKPLSILWTQLWNSREHLLVKDWSQQRRKRPPLLRIFLLRTLWCFPSLCFTEFCSWFHCFAVEINIYSIYRLWSRRCFTKRCFWLRVDIQRGLRCSRYRNSQCMDRMASKREVRKNTEWSAS